VYGVKGSVRIDSRTEPADGIFRYQPWFLVMAGTERRIDGCRGRAHGRGLVAQLPGVADRDAAAALVGAQIEVPRSALPAPAQGEYYWADLEGCEVVTADGMPLGRVSHLIATGANDVLVVADAVRERLIPFVPGTFVTEVDLDAGQLTVDWDPEF
jgi:16S rRNA processing protein RimM